MHLDGRARGGAGHRGGGTEEAAQQVIFVERVIVGDSRIAAANEFPRIDLVLEDRVQEARGVFLRQPLQQVGSGARRHARGEHFRGGYVDRLHGGEEVMTETGFLESWSL